MTVLNHTFQKQVTGYYCGPAATRVALTVRGLAPSQQELANSLGTTVNGTDSANNVVRTLNAYLGAGTYEATFIAGNDATTAQRDELGRDIRASVDAGYAVVANIVGPIRTNDGRSYTYSGGHYVCIVGYDGDNIYVDDINVGEYWVTLARMATWIAARGYASSTVKATAAPSAPAVASDPVWMIDVASWQAGVNFEQAKAAGVEIVNIKTSQGVSYTFQDGAFYGQEARRLGLAVCTFHWLDNSASGAAQAQYAYNQMLKIGGGTTDNVAHAVDCEDTAKPATFQIWQDYVNWMQNKLGRKIMNYTGDWWWVPRGWNGAALTPYFYAPPNNGYLSSYPGDASSQWHAGYGGWNDLSGMQYAVQPGTYGGGNISKTKLRPGVFNALAGRGSSSTIKKEGADVSVVFKEATSNTCYVTTGAEYRGIGEWSTVLAMAAAGLIATTTVYVVPDGDKDKFGGKNLDAQTVSPVTADAIAQAVVDKLPADANITAIKAALADLLANTRLTPQVVTDMNK